MYRLSDLGEMARPAGLEPATPSLEGTCSIRLSYGRLIEAVSSDLTQVSADSLSLGS